MEDSTLNTVVGLLCWAAVCLIPLGAIAGGVVFFRRRKQKLAAAVSSPVPAPQPFAYTPPPVTASPAGPFDPPVSPVEPPAAGISDAAGTAGTADAAADPGNADPFTQIPISVDPAPANPVGAPNAVSAANVVSAATSDFTPSEIVWLRGDAFAESAGMLNSEKVLYNDGKVKGGPLAAAVLQAALLALVEAGDARLEPARRKGLLRESDTLNLVPTGSAANWPAGSYEAELLKTARAVTDPKHLNVPALVFHVMQDDHNIPWMQVLERLKIGLAQRGLLDAGKGALGLSLKFAMTPAVAARVARLDVEPVRQALSRYAAAQPQLSDLLKKEINEGIGRRQESSD